MSDIPTSVDLEAGSQSPRRLRYGQVRGVNTLDNPIAVHTLYAASDIPNAIASGAWSDPINVQGYDAIYLFVTVSTIASKVLTINIQSGFTKGGTFYDRATSFDVATGNANAIPAGTSPTWANGDGTFVIRLDTVGHFMRFQPTLNTVNAGSRITILGQRAMLST